MSRALPAPSRALPVRRPLLRQVLGLGLLLGLGAARSEAPPGRARPRERSAVQMADAWMRSTPEGAVACLQLIGLGPRDDRLLELQCDWAGRVELRGPGQLEGRPGLWPLDTGLLLPAGEVLTMRPDGVHIALFELDRPLRPREQRPMRLIFERAGQHSLAFQVDESRRGTAPPVMPPAPEPLPVEPPA